MLSKDRVLQYASSDPIYTAGGQHVGASRKGLHLSVLIRETRIQYTVLLSHSCGGMFTFGDTRQLPGSQLAGLTCGLGLATCLSSSRKHCKAMLPV